MTAPGGISRVLAQTEAIIFDFDGPVCSVFAGYPASRIAAGLKTLLQGEGIALPIELNDEEDPLEVLRWASCVDRPNLIQAIDDSLREAELEAARSAEPTPNAREAIIAAKQAGKRSAIVSNNSTPAISRYLEKQRLTHAFESLFGRPYAEPHRMKPNPGLLLEVAQLLGVATNRCVLIGDSVTDIIGAHSAGMVAIGYANKPHKATSFKEAGVDGLVTSMAEIAAPLAWLATH